MINSPLVIKKHLYTTEKKENFFPGPWMDESDEVAFKHRNLDCLIKRIMTNEHDGWFGGHLCGYVFVPGNHDLYKCDDCEHVGCDVHGGITFNDYLDTEKRLALGFDCAHYCDLIPSVISQTKESTSRGSYKNIDFVISECKKLADFVADFKGEK